jgi:hypothetical protein
MAHVHISTAYSINPPPPTVCVCASPYVAKQGLGKKSYRGNEYTCNNRVVGRVDFYAIRVASKKIRRLVLPRTSCFPSVYCISLDSFVLLSRHSPLSSVSVTLLILNNSITYFCHFHILRKSKNNLNQSSDWVETELGTSWLGRRSANRWTRQVFMFLCNLFQMKRVCQRNVHFSQE